MTTAKKPPLRKKKPKAIAVIETKPTPLADLMMYHKNPRIGNVNAIAASLEENGQFKPIVVNIGTHTGRKNEILAGNHTYMGMKKLGEKLIYASFVDVDEQQATKIVLADNKTADLGTYDEKIIADLFDSLPDIAGTGYSQEEFEDIMSSVSVDISDSSKYDSDVDVENLIGGINMDNEEQERREDTMTDRERYKAERESDDDGEEARSTRISASDDADEELSVDADEQQIDKLAELQVVLEMKEDNVWKNPNDFYGIPRIPERSILKEFPKDIVTWIGHQYTEQKPGRHYLYNYSLGGTKNLDFSKTILAFNCVDVDTEALTQRGWLSYDQIDEDDHILSMDPKTGDLVWSVVRSIFRKHYTGKMHHLQGSAMDALVTPDHKFPTVDGELVKVQELQAVDRLRTMGNAAYNTPSIYTDSFVELVGWSVTEGHYRPGIRRHSVCITQKEGGAHVPRIRKAIEGSGAQCHEGRSGTNCISFSVTGDVANTVHEVAPDRVLSHEFVLALSSQQRQLLIDTMLDGDGWRTGKNAQQYFQKDVEHIESFVMLCALQGIPTTTVYREWVTAPNGDPIMSSGYTVTLKQRKTAAVNKLDWNGGRVNTRSGRTHQPTVDYDDVVWCPQTDYGTWVCRRAGKVYVTGNTYDTKFISWWETPAYNLARLMVKGLTTAVVPDFSYYYTEARIHHLWGVYRANWLGRFFAEAGLQVVPRLQWDFRDPEFMKTALPGVPLNTPTLECSIQNINEEEDRKKAAKQLRDLLEYIKPEQFMVYGGNPAQRLVTESGWKGEVIHVLSYANARRESGAYDRKEGKASLTAKQKKELREKYGAKETVVREDGEEIDENEYIDEDDI